MMISALGFAEHHQITIYYAELEPAEASPTHVGGSERSRETNRAPHNPQVRISPALCRDRHNRRNYLFAGSDGGGHSAAVIYSLIGTARLNGVEPFAYLRAVFERVADHPINRIDELLPWRLMPAEHVEQQAA
jgi:hypothetical protein